MTTAKIDKNPDKAISRPSNLATFRQDKKEGRERSERSERIEKRDEDFVPALEHFYK